MSCLSPRVGKEGRLRKLKTSAPCEQKKGRKGVYRRKQRAGKGRGKEGDKSGQHE